MAKLNINGKTRDVDVEPDTPLLWVLREQVGLTGTKYGCGVAQCGACAVHFNGEVRALLRDPGRQREADRPDRHHRGSVAATSRIRCRRRGRRSTCRSAAIASRARSWRRRRCWRKNPQPTDARHRRGDDEHLPMRHVPAHPCGGAHGGAPTCPSPKSEARRPT